MISRDAMIVIGHETRASAARVVANGIVLSASIREVEPREVEIRTAITGRNAHGWALYRSDKPIGDIHHHELAGAIVAALEDFLSTVVQGEIRGIAILDTANERARAALYGLAYMAIATSDPEPRVPAIPASFRPTSRWPNPPTGEVP